MFEHGLVRSLRLTAKDRQFEEEDTEAEPVGTNRPDESTPVDAEGEHNRM